MVRRLPISRDWDAGKLTISQQVFAESTVAKFGVTRGKSVPAVVDQKRELFDHDEPTSISLFGRWYGI